jgi:HEAT repeat protein
MRTTSFGLALVLLVAGACPAQLTIPKEQIPPDIPVAVRQQIDLLYSANAEKRVAALRALGQMGTKAAPAIPWLIELLGDDSGFTPFPLTPYIGSQVWRAAWEQFPKIGDATLGPLRAATRRADPCVRIRSAHLLVTLGDREALETIAAALAERNAYAQLLASQILVELKDRRAVDPLIARLRESLRRERLGTDRPAELTIPKEQIPKDIPVEVQEQIDLLYSADVVKRLAALGELGRMGAKAAPAIPWLIELLGDDYIYSPSVEGGPLLRTPVWRVAWRQFAYIGDAALDPLRTATRHANPRVRIRSAHVLVTLGHREAVETIVAALADEDLGIQDLAARVLVELKDPRADTPQFARLREGLRPDWFNTVRLLGQARDPRATEPLAAALAATNDESQWEPFIASLGRIGKAPADLSPVLKGLKAKRQDCRWRTATALGEMKDPRAVDALLEALGSNDGFLRSHAASALGQIADRRAVSPLIQILQVDPFGDARAHAARSLGQIGDPAAEAPLVAALQDGSLLIRRTATEALGLLREPRTVAPLAEAMKRGSEAAAGALARIGEPAIPVLTEALGDPDPNVRLLAVDGLGQTRLPQAFPLLLDSLTDKDMRVCQRAISWLGRSRDERMIDPLAEVLQSTAYRDTKVAAINALMQIGDRRVVEALAAGLWGAHDEDVQRKAAEALAQIGEPAVPALAGLLDHPSDRIRPIVANTLAGMGEPGLNPLGEAYRRSKGSNADAERALCRMGPRGAHVFLEALNDPDTIACGRAVRALGDMKERRAVGPLIEVLQKRQSPWVKDQAAHALSKITDQDFGTDGTRWRAWWNVNSKMFLERKEEKADP